MRNKKILVIFAPLLVYWLRPLSNDKTYIGRFSLPLTCANHHLANINKSEIAENASHVFAYLQHDIQLTVSCYFVLSASEPCGEAAYEDDSESGSPFLCALTNTNHSSHPTEP